MLTCAFIICLAQIAVAVQGLRNWRAMPLKNFIGHVAALGVAGGGAIGLWPLVFGGV